MPFQALRPAFLKSTILDEEGNYVEAFEELLELGDGIFKATKEQVYKKSKSDDKDYSQYYREPAPENSNEEGRPRCGAPSV